MLGWPINTVSPAQLTRLRRRETGYWLARYETGSRLNFLVHQSYAQNIFRLLKPLTSQLADLESPNIS